MRKLLLAPNQAGYSAGYGAEAKMARLEGGRAAYRRSFLGTSARVSASWNLTRGMADYLMAFYRYGTQRASEPFLIDLVLDGADLEEYQANFVPESLQFIGYRGTARMYSAELEIKPRADDPATDLSRLVVYEAYGEEGWDIYNMLAVLVNEDIPA